MRRRTLKHPIGIPESFISSVNVRFPADPRDPSNSLATWHADRAAQHQSTPLKRCAPYLNLHPLQQTLAAVRFQDSTQADSMLCIQVLRCSHVLFLKADYGTVYLTIFHAMNITVRPLNAANNFL